MQSTNRPRKSRLIGKLFGTMMAAVALAGTPAGATEFSIDNSDLWWSPNESGWGLQLVQRSEVIFATLFVYSTASTPVWYSATLEPSGFSSWTGALMQCQGPFFGATPFNPSAVSCSQVGTMTFGALSDHDGTLSYTVNGVAVNKNITRQTLRVDDPSGSYAGVLSLQSGGCPNPADNSRRQNRIDFELIQKGNALTMVSQEQESTAVCTSGGDYAQYGQFAASRQVTSSCSDGTKANNVTLLYEVNVSFTGVTLNFTAPSTNPGQKGCTLTGSIYGIRQ